MIKIITIITILFCSKVIAVDKPAILEASQKLSLSPEQAGLITHSLKAGDRFNESQLLLQLHDASLDLHFKKLSLERAALLKEQVFYKKRLAEKSEQFSKGLIPSEDFATAKHDAELVLDKLGLLKLEFKEITLARSQRAITAPFQGQFVSQPASSSSTQYHDHPNRKCRIC